MPIKNTRYLVAPSGTVHLRKPGTTKSWCGRVTVGQEGVKGTNKTPEVLCKRDTLLSGGTDKPADKPAAAANGVRGTRAKGRLAQAATGGATAVVDTVTVPTTLESLSNGLDDHALYARIDAYLTANDTDPVYNDGPDGVSISFIHDSWIYTAWAPKFNASGLGEGWVITYRGIDEDSGVEDIHVDAQLNNELDVIGWIKEDTGMTKKGRAVSPRKSNVMSGLTAAKMVASHLVTIMSNAAEATSIAKRGKMSADVVDALTDMKKAADELRKLVSATK